MDQYRLGTCSSCEAQYRVPATFKADKAKCKKCGGVVEIGSVQGAAPTAKPAPAKQPRPQRPAKSAKPARPAKAKPAAAAAPAAEEESVRSATEEAATRVRSSGSKSKKSGGSSSRRKKGRTSKKKDSKMGLVLGLVALLIIAGGGGWFLMNKDKSVEAQDSPDVAAADSEQAEGTGGTEGEGPEATSPEATESDEQATETGADESPAAAAGATLEDETTGEETPEEEAAPSKPVKQEVVLAELEDFGPAPGTSDEEWAEIQALVATSIDPNAGARGNRATNTLFEKGRFAFPAVLNVFKTLDLTTENGYRDGDLLQKLLERICQGNNYGWRYSTEEQDVTFNKKVVAAWFSAWNLVVGEDADGSMWAAIAKLDDEQKAAYLIEIGLESEGKAAGDVGSADELDDF